MSAMPVTRHRSLERRRLGQSLLVTTATLMSLAGLPPAIAWAQPPLTEGVTAASQTAPDVAPVPEAPPDIGPLELLMLSLVNGARIGAELPPLKWDGAMAEAARQHARDMMTRGVVSHSGADGSTPQQRLRRAGVEFRFGSENIWTYWGKVPEEGPRTMHAAMMAEPFRPGLWNHIGNILYAGYKRIGIGIVTAPRGVQYLSEKFAD